MILATQCINTEKLEKHQEKFLGELFIYVVLLSIQIKSGKTTHDWRNEEEFGLIHFGSQTNKLIGNSVVGFKFIDDYLKDSYISLEEISNILQLYIDKLKYEDTLVNESLKKLDRYWIIPENELIQIINDIKDKIINNYYRLESYSDIFVKLLSIYMIGVANNEIDLIFSKIKSNIENNIVEGTYIEVDCWNKSEEFYSLYKEKCTEIIAKIHNNCSNDIQLDVSNIYKLEEWGEKLHDFCDEKISKILNDRKFAYLLDSEMIINNIKNKDIEQIYEFLYGLQKIYDSSNIKEYLIDDLDILITFQISLKNLSIERNLDKVRVHALQIVDEYLIGVINKLS